MVSFDSLVSAALATAAVTAWSAPRVAVRRRVGSTAEPAAQRRWGVLIPLGAALAVAVFVDGITGLFLGALVGIWIYRWRKTKANGQDTEAAARRALGLPVALDLLSACLTVGTTPARALEAVAGCVDGSLRSDLHIVAGAIRSGADVTEAWTLIEAPDLQVLGTVLARAEISGTSATPLLALLADQHRRQARAVAMDAARALGVRLTGPLGLCFLPAFILIAVVPLVMSVLPFPI